MPAQKLWLPVKLLTGCPGYLAGSPNCCAPGLMRFCTLMIAVNTACSHSKVLWPAQSLPSSSRLTGGGAPLAAAGWQRCTEERPSQQPAETTSRPPEHAAQPTACCASSPFASLPVGAATGSAGFVSTMGRLGMFCTSSSGRFQVSRKGWVSGGSTSPAMSSYLSVRKE